MIKILPTCFAAAILYSNYTMNKLPKDSNLRSLIGLVCSILLLMEVGIVYVIIKNL